jgi:hypothetical protein
VDRPPEETIRIPAVSQESLLCTKRAQANEQAWQPMHRSMRGVVRILAVFMSFPYVMTLQLRHFFDPGFTA